MTINHKDGNRFNNHITNLEWLSLADNIRHAFSTGLMPFGQRTTLLIAGKVYEFESLSKACSFIGRSHGYIADCRKRGVPIRDEDGSVIEIVA